MSDADDDIHLALRHNVRRMVDAKIRPHALEVDERAEFPVRSMAAFRELELLGLAYPTELGGGGGDLLAQVLVIEEVARACASSASILLTSWAALTPILDFGSEALKKEIVPKIAAGDQLASFCLTEPGGGSDLPGLKTRAEKVDGGWRLHGHKRFISNAQHSEWYAVLARSGAPKEPLFGVFLVHQDDPGLSFGAQEKKMGMRGFPTADVILEDVFVADAHVVGDAGRGYSYMMDTLTYTRPLVGAHALGIAQGALDASIRYTRDRTQFGAPIARFQMVREMVSDMMTAVEAARSLLYRSAEIASVSSASDERARAFASMAKVFCSDTAMKVTTDAVQLHGGNGYMRDYQVERMMRDAKVTQIWEGTNHIQKLLVSKYAYST